MQNLCIAATALGYASAWRTGWFVEHDLVRAALGATHDERIIGMIHLGTPRESSIRAATAPLQGSEE